VTLRRIKEDTQGMKTCHGVIRFSIPSINFQAERYCDLMNWDDFEREEPPLLANIRDEDLDAAVKKSQKFEFLIIPCASQTVERHVKLVTEATSAVHGLM